MAGANIKLAAVRGPYKETHASTVHALKRVTADAQGRFVLTSLRADSRYFFFVDAPGFAGKLLSGIGVAPSELKVALGPELSVRGRFLHVPAASLIAEGKTQQAARVFALASAARQRSPAACADPGSAVV